MTKKHKPLFVAPIDIKEGDGVVLFMGQPAIIYRDGKEIWYAQFLSKNTLDVLRERTDLGDQKEG